MDTPVELSLSISKAQAAQMDLLAQQLGLSPSQLAELALAYFLKANQGDSNGQMENRPINQGDLFWIQLESSAVPHPHVVIQDDLLNYSRLSTVVLCALTSNIQRVSIPGNVLLETGIANLPRQSVVEVSKVSSVPKTQLGDYIGSLTQDHLQQIWAGMRLLQTSYFHR